MKVMKIALLLILSLCCKSISASDFYSGGRKYIELKDGIEIADIKTATIKIYEGELCKQIVKYDEQEIKHLQEIILNQDSIVVVQKDAMLSFEKILNKNYRKNKYQTITLLSIIFILTVTTMIK